MLNRSHCTDAGHYLNNVFVRYQIRFIALSNGIDTATSHMNTTTSVNVRGTLNVNREQGKFIGSFAAYGYLKAPADHHSCRVHSAQFRDNSLCVNLLRQALIR